MLLIFFSAVKKADSRSDVIPQQGFYTRAWKGTPPSEVSWSEAQSPEAGIERTATAAAHSQTAQRLVASFAIVAGAALVLASFWGGLSASSLVAQWSPVALVALGLYFWK